MKFDWWTLGIQTLNVAVLVWLLERFFWRPVAAMIEARRAEAARIVTEAGATSARANAALAAAETARAGLAGERRDMLAAAAGEAAGIRTAALAKASEEAAAAQAASAASIAHDRLDAEKAWTERSSRLAVDIAGRLAARLDGSAIQAAFLQWLLAALRALPASSRSAASAGGAPLVATSALPIPAADQAHYRELIGEAFGGHPRLTFEVDPDLIGGLELSGPHLAVTNSWRADLRQILAGLVHA